MSEYAPNSSKMLTSFHYLVLSLENLDNTSGPSVLSNAKPFLTFYGM
jgi:hypothetical protein